MKAIELGVVDRALAQHISASEEGHRHNLSTICLRKVDSSTEAEVIASDGRVLVRTPAKLAGKGNDLPNEVMLPAAAVISAVNNSYHDYLDKARVLVASDESGKVTMSYAALRFDGHAVTHSMKPATSHYPETKGLWPTTPCIARFNLCAGVLRKLCNFAIAAGKNGEDTGIIFQFYGDNTALAVEIDVRGERKATGVIMTMLAPDKPDAEAI